MTFQIRIMPTELPPLYLLICSPLLFRFSVSNDLKYDAERDLRDIGAKNIQVHSLNKVRFSHDT